MRRLAALPIVAAAALGGCGPGGREEPMNRRSEEPPPRRIARQSGPCVGPIAPDALARCDFGPAERMRGVWLTGFERSEYVPGGTGAHAEGDAPAPRSWLAFAPGVLPDPALRSELDKLGATAAVDIDFIGRRARPPGAVVIVDRIVSARSLGPIRPD